MTFVVYFQRKDEDVDSKAAATRTASSSKQCRNCCSSASSMVPVQTSSNSVQTAITVTFTVGEKSLMREISQLTEEDSKPSGRQKVTYTAEEREMMAELMHTDILRVISENSSSTERQAKAADRRAEMKKARVASLADSAIKATSSVQERRERVKALAEKNRRQAKAAASQMLEVSN